MRLLWQLLHGSTGYMDIARLEKLIDVGNDLNLGISLDKSQELYFSCLHSQIIPQYPNHLNDPGEATQYRQLLKLGEKLGIDVSNYG